MVTFEYDGKFTMTAHASDGDYHWRTSPEVATEIMAATSAVAVEREVPIDWADVAIFVKAVVDTLNWMALRYEPPSIERIQIEDRLTRAHKLLMVLT